MKEQHVEFVSQGYRIVGIVRWPDQLDVATQHPAMLVLHGFGSNMSAENVLGPCAELEAMGYRRCHHSLACQNAS